MSHFWFCLKTCCQYIICKLSEVLICKQLEVYMSFSNSMNNLHIFIFLKRGMKQKQ